MYRIGLLIICLFAFALRLYLLEDIYLHEDEATSLSRYIEQPVHFILTDYTPNNHWLSTVLGYVMSQLGHQRFFVRWPSVFFGTLAVPLIGLAGNLLYRNRRDGLAASLLLSFSAFHLQWSQQFRGYSTLLFFALLSFLLLYQALRTGRKLYWFGVPITGVLVVMSHLYGVMVLIILVAVLVSWLWGSFIKEGKRFPQAGWAIAISLFATIIIGYFIWFGKTHIINVYHSPSQTSLIDLFEHQWFAVNPTQDEIKDFLEEVAITFTAQRDAGSALTLFWGLSIAGVALSRRHFLYATLLLALWLIVPFVVVIIAEFTVAGFFVFDRYLIFVLPAWLILVARSLTVSSSWLARHRLLANAIRPAIFIFLMIVGLGYLSLLNLSVVRAYYAERASHDWQSIAAYLADHTATTDLIVCKQLPHRWPPGRLDLGDTCTKELSHRLAALGVKPRFPIKQFEIVATLNTGLRFRDQANTSGAVWLVIWGDDVPVPTFPNRGRLLIEIVSKKSMGQAEGLSYRPRMIAFNRLGNTILLKVDIGPSLVANLGQALEHLIRLDTSSPDRFDYYLRLAQILAYQGHNTGAKTSLSMARKLAHNYPEALAETIDALQTISNLDQPRTSPNQKIRADFGTPPTIRLTGFAFPTTVLAGQTVPITVSWQPLAAIPADYTIFLHLRNAAGQTVAQLDFRPFDGFYPTSQWTPASTIKETRFWALPADLSPDIYTLYLGLYQVETLAHLPVAGDRGENAILLAEVRVEQ